MSKRGDFRFPHGQPSRPEPTTRAVGAFYAVNKAKALYGESAGQTHVWMRRDELRALTKLAATSAQFLRARAIARQLGQSPGPDGGAPSPSTTNSADTPHD